jgi:hypothetical protein
MKADSKITFLVKSGSGPKPYLVDFVFKNDCMFVSCDCPAAKFGKFCKHKIRLIQEDFDILYDDTQSEDLVQIGDWIQRSEFLDLILERSKFKKEFREAQQRLDAVKRKMQPVEKKMAQAMKDEIRQIM